MEKFLENIQEAQKTIQIIDHMIYVTYPLIKDKKILTKLLTETKKVIANCINSILQYEYLYKRITLYQNPKTNFKIFKEQCAKRYEITQEQVHIIINLFELVEKHKQSTMEFLKNEKVVILSKNLETETITIDKLKEFFNLSKDIMKKTLAVIK